MPPSRRGRAQKRNHRLAWPIEAPTLITRPLATIFVIQALMTMASYSLAVIIPDAAGDIGLSPDAVGYLTGAMFLTAMLTGPATPVLIRMLGATRVFQWLIALIAFAAFALIAAHPVLAFLGAVVIGLATGPMNPSGSHVLARVSPRRWLPLVFSIKQCGTPAGGMLAGAVLPVLALELGWQSALAVLPAAACVLILLTPLGKLGDRSLEAPSNGRVVEEMLGSLRAATATPALRQVCLSGACLGACQLALASYYVVYLWSVAGMSTTAAGRTFVVFHIVGIVARIVLGTMAERWVPTRTLLGLLGGAMALGIVGAGYIDETSSLLYIYGVTALLGASANGWVGLFFAELARLVPNQAALVAGGGQFVMYLGIVLGPVIFAALLTTTGSYPLCFAVFTAIALVTLAPIARRDGPPQERVKNQQ